MCSTECYVTAILLTLALTPILLILILFLFLTKISKAWDSKEEENQLEITWQWKLQSVAMAFLRGFRGW